MITELTQSNSLYQYTSNENRTGSYIVNGLNQYTTVNGSNLSYDANGNLTNDNGTLYTYDDENRLRGTSGLNIAASTLKYDPLGRLYEITINGTKTTFLYDGDALVAEYNASNQMTNRYVHGDQVDEPWVQYESAAVGSSNWRFLHADHQGSIVARSTAAGALWGNALSYDSYGIPKSTNQGRFGYTGQAWLKELGLFHYKARVYHPKLGRFLQTDPIFYKDNMNMYGYVGNDPMNKIDPTGMFEFENCKSTNDGKYECGMSSGNDAKSGKKTDPIVKGIKADMRQYKSEFKKKEHFGLVYMKGTTMKSIVISGKKTTVSKDEQNKMFRDAKLDGATRYIGDWHSHPPKGQKGASWSVSDDDVTTANEIQGKVSGEYRPFFSDPDYNLIEWDASATTVLDANSTNVNHGAIDEE